MFIQDKLQAWRTATNLTGPCPMSDWLTLEQNKLNGLDINSKEYANKEDVIRQQLLLHPDWSTQLSWQGFKMVEGYTEPRRGIAQFTFLTHVLTAPFPTLGRSLKAQIQKDIEKDIVTDPKVLKLMEDYLAIEELLPGDIRWDPANKRKSGVPLHIITMIKETN
jgi:hypothetical protein